MQQMFALIFSKINVFNILIGCKSGNKWLPLQAIVITNYLLVLRCWSSDAPAPLYLDEAKHPQKYPCTLKSTLLVHLEKEKTSASCYLTEDCILSRVPRPGLEPGWVAPLVFETSASTDSAIWAQNAGAKIINKIENRQPKIENFIKHSFFLAFSWFI